MNHRAKYLCWALGTLLYGGCALGADSSSDGDGGSGPVSSGGSTAGGGSSTGGGGDGGLGSMSDGGDSFGSDVGGGSTMAPLDAGEECALVEAEVVYTYDPPNTLTQGSAEYAQAAISRNIVPAPNQILARDFANRYPPDYSLPTTELVGLQVDVEVGDEMVNADQATTFVLQAAAIGSANVEPQTLELVVVADTSASMDSPSEGGDNSTALARQAAFLKGIASRLQPGDTLKLITWNLETTQYIEGADDPASLKDAIDALETDGSVSPAEALVFANGNFTSDADTLKRLVVVTDGGFDANDSTIRDVALDLVLGPLFVGVGVGDPDIYLSSGLHDFARIAQGAHRYAASLEASSSLADEFAGLFYEVAKSIEFQIHTTGVVQFEQASAAEGIAQVRQAGLGPGQVSVFRRKAVLCDNTADLDLTDAGAASYGIIVDLLVDGVLADSVPVDLPQAPAKAARIQHVEGVLIAADALSAPSAGRLEFAAEWIKPLPGLGELRGMLLDHPNYTGP